MEKTYFIVKMTGTAMVSPAGPFCFFESALRLLPGTGGYFLAFPLRGCAAGQGI